MGCSHFKALRGNELYLNNLCYAIIGQAIVSLSFAWAHIVLIYVKYVGVVVFTQG